MEKNIMYNFTKEDHRIRLENIRHIEKNLKNARRKNLITDYECAQYVWPFSRFDNPEEYEPKLRELAEKGVNLIQTWSAVAAVNDDNGEMIDESQFYGDWMYRPYDKEKAKKFINTVHKYGMKILPYTSTNFYHRNDERFCEEWASDKMYDLGYLAHCSVLSPGWREQILRQFATLMDEYDFDGVYIDTGYQRICDYSTHTPYYYDELRVTPDEVLAFPESREHDGGMQDLLGLIYGECKKRGKILKLHKEGFDTVRSDFKIYDYLWVGEAVEDINLIREHSKDYDAYVVPDFNYPVENDHERYLNTIPFMQFPILRDAKTGIGDPRADVPKTDSMFKWLNLYKKMTTYGTWAYVDINIPKLIKPEGEKTVVTAFINLDMYIVIANYSNEEDTVKINGDFTEITVDGDGDKISDTLVLAPRQMKILRLNTPEEWKHEKIHKIGISDEALL